MTSHRMPACCLSALVLLLAATLTKAGGDVTFVKISAEPIQESGRERP